jgi:hypothetical protein
MGHIIRYMTVTLMIATFVGCSKTTNDPSVCLVSFGIDPYTVLDEDGQAPMTRTSIVEDNNSLSFFWAEGDTVGIYPTTGSQVYFELAAGVGASNAVFDGGGWDFKSSTFYYSYYPFVGDIYLDRHHIPVSYLGQKQVGTGTSFSHLGPFDFMYTGGVESSNTGSISFTYYHLSAAIRLRLVLPAGTYTKLAITSPDEDFTLEGYYDLVSSAPTIIATKLGKQLSMDLESITSTGSSEVIVYLMSAPVILTGKEITVSVLNSERKEYQCKKTPSYAYGASDICKMGCTSFTEVPKSMRLIIDDWDDGGSIGGDAD